MISLAEAARRRWDAVVVGSGAGGGVAAWRLAAAGGSVLVLERGARVPRRPLVPDEIAACRRDLFVPAVADDPHILVADGAAPRRSFEGWTACCVGGGTVHMSAMLYRLHDEDLAAWPLPGAAAALRRAYDAVQAAIGLAGVSGENPFEPVADPYPETPLAAHPAAAAVRAAARAAGLSPYTTPRGHLPVARDGRGPCVRCGYCGSYACPTGAKASTADVFLPAAEAGGRCLVLPGARAVELLPGRGVVAVAGDATRVLVPAGRVLLAASAVESARLLLLSRLGGDGVGQGLELGLGSAGHAVFAHPSPLFPEEGDRLPFLNVSLQDRYRDAGTLVLERAHPNPIQRGLAVARAGALGPALVRGLVRAFRQEREVVWESFFAPAAPGRVELDPDVRDAAGLPAARLVVASSPRDGVRAALLAAAARDVLGRLDPLRVEDGGLQRAGYLLAGGCAMGPVTGADGQLHGVAGVHVVDGGALPSLGGVPPTLTIMANAWRVADGIARGG